MSEPTTEAHMRALYDEISELQQKVIFLRAKVIQLSERDDTQPEGTP